MSAWINSQAAPAPTSHKFLGGGDQPSEMDAPTGLCSGASVHRIGKGLEKDGEVKVGSIKYGEVKNGEVQNATGKDGEVEDEGALKADKVKEEEKSGAIPPAPLILRIKGWCGRGDAPRKYKPPAKRAAFGDSHSRGSFRVGTDLQS
ncbi:hypothetical protein PGTUg99_001203 [Puccinia graminis f. sp. tritici]|uniref:Uncharacterized protein n=1 Tax=Puccinia graminis f. sp. tritici TaxID=56615 RepID=A0A5B0P4C5_PUCGR|nr:hypothetical protein PGTUg99_036331 [Puccinia graminis f. sp. tritici]KAA1130470.1 hypothetical protein PGTUg99_001203 [Puccinia graminis f. sp. tritici]